MAEKNRSPVSSDAERQQDGEGTSASPQSLKRSQSRRQISLPFVSDAESPFISERDQLHALVSSLPVILFTLNRQANFTMLEGQGVALLGSDRHALVGRPFVDLYPDTVESRTHFSNALDGTPVRWTVHLRGQLLITTLTPLRNREDIVTGLLGVGQVVPAGSVAKESSENGSPGSAGAVQEGTQFFAQVSHELRTPLNSIVGFANLLLNNPELRLGEQDLFYLQRVAGNAAHLIGVVGDMMDLAAVESGKVKITRSEVDLGVLIRETVEEIGSASKPDGLELRVNIPENIRAVETDRRKLKQIIINLLANALKFTRQGSISVIIGVDASMRPVRIAVEDTGVGIQAEDLDSIFEAFERGEQRGGQEIEGSGLGLTVTKALCVLLGYNILVESEPGKGSTFTIELTSAAAEQSR